MRETERVVIGEIVMDAGANALSGFGSNENPSVVCTAGETVICTPAVTVRLPARAVRVIWYVPGDGKI